MRKWTVNSSAGIICGILMATVLWVPAQAQIVNSYHEDFSQSLMKDPAQTTVEWSTVDEEIRLYRFTMNSVGYYNTSGYAKKMTIAGNYCYVADYTQGLLVLDITNPETPTFAGQYNSPGYTNSVAVQGNYAYIADGDLGIKVVDITNPAAPNLVGSLDSTIGTAMDIAVAGDLAYLACNSDGFQVIDVSDPTNPVHVDSHNVLIGVSGLDLQGDLLYVTASNDGLWVFDVTDPLAITTVGSFDTPGNARNVTVKGNKAYVADSSSLIVLDVTDPSLPTSLGSATTGSTVMDVDVVGSFAYVADYSAGLVMLNVAAPGNIHEVDRSDILTTGLAVAVHNDIVYFTTGYPGLYAFSASEETPLSLLGGNDYAYGYQKPVIDGDLVFAPAVIHGLLIHDLSDPIGLPTVSVFREVGKSYTTYGVAVAGNYAYVSDNTQGLLVLDVSDPSDPVLVEQVSTPCKYIAVQGNVAFTSGGGFINAYDISDPTDVALLASYLLVGGSDKLDVSGKFLYVAQGTGGFAVLEFNSSGGYFASSYGYTLWDVADVEVDGDILYLAAGADGLKVYDIRNPYSLVLIKNVATTDEVVAVTIDGDDLFLSLDYAGIIRLDVSGPDYPSVTGTYLPGIRNVGVAVSGDYLVLGSSYDGLAVLTAKQRMFNTGAAQAGSYALTTTSQPAQVRVTTTQQDGVSWELSVDEGQNWWTAPADGTWNAVYYPGNHIQWRSNHSVVDPQQNPSCSDLVIEWLYAAPMITSIEDVPGDQGLQVSLSWQRSAFDYLGSATPITDYSIYRKIEGSMAVDQSQDPAKAYPDGDWHFLMSVPADTEDSYAVVASTLGDSTISGGQYSTTFFVRARTATPGVHYDAVPVSGYSVDNLAPSVPAGLNMATQDRLAWDEVVDDDFDYFTVYESDNVVLDQSATVLGYTTGSGLDVSGRTRRYLLVTATDFAGNESQAGQLHLAASAPNSDLPTKSALYGNYPNPFNPSTTISFDLRIVTPVRLRVFDLSGRVVRTLIDGQILAAGRHSESWNGIDATGQPVATGVYLYRLEAGDFHETRRMILIK